MNLVLVENLAWMFHQYCENRTIVFLGWVGCATLEAYAVCINLRIPSSLPPLISYHLYSKETLTQANLESYTLKNISWNSTCTFEFNMSISKECLSCFYRFRNIVWLLWAKIAWLLMGRWFVQRLIGKINV